MKREFLQLAQTYDGSQCINGWLASEKLDGERCFWDGGITRGLRCDAVPWANTTKDKKVKYASGLWSRNGKPIQALKAWLDTLPKGVTLDGELYAGHGQRQFVHSVIKRDIPDDRWYRIKYCVFDSPAPQVVFADGLIETAHYVKNFSRIMDWWTANGGTEIQPSCLLDTYNALIKMMDAGLIDPKYVEIVSQHELPRDNTCSEVLDSMLEQVVQAGGEGLIVRRASSYYETERTWNCLKVKKLKDSEARVIGYTWGKETDKGSRLLGRMGSVRLIWENDKGKTVTFSLASGFDDDQRNMIMQDGTDAYYIGIGVPGAEVTGDIYNPFIPIGTEITFKYRDLTEDGLPVEARFWRRRDD